MTYRDLRGIPEFVDKTILAIKAPPDTLLKCEVQEVMLRVHVCMYQLYVLVRYQNLIVLIEVQWNPSIRTPL